MKCDDQKCTECMKGNSKVKSSKMCFTLKIMYCGIDSSSFLMIREVTYKLMTKELARKSWTYFQDSLEYICLITYNVDDGVSRATRLMALL